MRGVLRSIVLRLIGEPGAADTFRRDRDRSSIARYQAAILARKGVLRRELQRRDSSIWSAYLDVITPIGRTLEVGTGLAPISGAGVIHTDVYQSPGVDCVASAQELPFRSGSFTGVLGVHMFHHLHDPVAFLNEAARVLSPGGALVLFEPNFNRLSRLVFGRLHPERFDGSQTGWSEEQPIADTDANQALAWIIFFRDRERLRREVPALEFDSSRPVSSLSFALTGGYLLKPLLPSRLIGLVARVTSRGALLRWLSIHRVIVLRRSSL